MLSGTLLIRTMIRSGAPVFPEAKWTRMGLCLGESFMAIRPFRYPHQEQVNLSIGTHLISEISIYSNRPPN